jgi:hypothetical protein
MTIKELQEVITKAVTDFSRTNEIGVREIQLAQIHETGNRVPIAYEVTITVE